MFNKIFTWFENRLTPYPDKQPETPPNKLGAFIWASIDGMKKWILLLAIFTMGMGALEALLFQFMGILVNWLSTYTPSTLWQQKGSYLIAMIAVLVGSILLSFLATTTKLQVLQGNFPMRLRWNFHRLMLGQSLSFYQDEFAGRVSAKVMQTALAVRDTVLSIANMAVYIAVYFLTSGIILVNLDSWLLVPFIIWAILFGTVLRFLIPKLSKTAQNQANARSLMTGRITDAYSNITTVKLFSHASREASYAKSSMKEFMVTVYAQMRLATSLDTLVYAVNIMLILSTGILSVYLWSINTVAVGAIATATAMALRVNGMARWIMWEAVRMFENIGTVNDGMKTISQPHSIVDDKDAKPLIVKQGDINFKNINFSYANHNQLLRNFNLHIKPGEKIGLIGRSGAGKSTIVNLLLRFYEPQSGCIEIDGQNIEYVNQDSLRENIGLVTQDTSLLHRSVRDNIIYGRPDATEEEVIEAIKKAKAFEFIPELTDAKGRKGLEAHVGERGVKLSGGQRQRIAIARVMLKDAPILLLDEATSALDSEVEVAIQESLDKMMENKTVIAIAHRLSTIAAMDRLIVLDQGEIIEEGSHAQLLAKKGLYAKLWQHQSGGFLKEHMD